MLSKQCRVQGCTKLASKKKLCESHYRKALLKTNPPCTVEGCDTPQVARSVCNKHRLRLRKHNSLDIPEKVKKDYSKHGLYGIWHWHANRTRLGVVDEWQDFDTFVEGVSPVPKHDTRLRKIDINEKLGPDNHK